jgi:hypothetical protein
MLGLSNGHGKGVEGGGGRFVPRIRAGYLSNVKVEICFTIHLITFKPVVQPTLVKLVESIPIKENSDGSKMVDNTITGNTVYSSQ